MKLFNKGAIALGCAMIMAASGCGAANSSKIDITSENVAEAVAGAKEALADVNEVSADMSIAINLNVGEETSEGVTNVKIEDRKDPMLMHIYSTGTQDGAELEGALEFYIENDGEKHTLYTDLDGVWYKQDIEDQYVGYIVGQYYVAENADVILEYVENLAVEGEEAVNGNKAYKITGDIPSDSIYEVVEGTAAFNYIGFAGLEESYYTDDEAVPIRLWIDETGMLVKYEIDYTGVLNCVIETFYASVDAETDFSMDTLVVGDYSISVDITGYDKLEGFSIPEEIKSCEPFEAAEAESVTVE